MVTFDTNILVYATATVSDFRVVRARDLLARAMRSASGVLMLQALAEFSNVALRKAKIPVKNVRRAIDGWRAVLPVQASNGDDLTAALRAVQDHQLQFWDAMLWAAAQRAGVRYLLTEDWQDGFELRGVTFVNPFNSANATLIDEKVLPP